jgi:hypothetical protein
MLFHAVVYAIALDAISTLHAQGCAATQTDDAHARPIRMPVSDYKLKPKPWWLRACTKNWQWVTIDPKIYHPPRQNPQERQAIIEHEKVHLAQQRRMGKYKWIIKYVAAKRFRLGQEMEPIVVELSNTPLDARPALAAKYARDLAGPPYSRAAESAEGAMEAILARAEEMGVKIAEKRD